MTLWLTLNTLGLAILGGVTFLMLRQVGFLLQRSGPVGARGTSEGPRIGESIVSHFAPAGIQNGKSKLLVFLSDACSVCKSVKEGAEPLARVWGGDAEIFLVYDAFTPGDQSELKEICPSLYQMRDFKLREKLGATFVPYAAVTDKNGIVVSKALVNEIAHLESLLEVEMAQRDTSKNRLGESGIGSREYSFHDVSPSES